MGKKGFIKGLAAGAVLGAVAHLIYNMDHRDQKKAALVRTAEKMRKKVMAHAKSVGKLSKAAYYKIVDTATAELRGVKDLSEGELKELKAELKENWMEVKKMMEDKKK